MTPGSGTPPRAAGSPGLRRRSIRAIFAALLVIGVGIAVADTPGTDLTVTPNTNLNPAGQNVQVSGTGFGPSGSGAIQQCIQRDEFTEDCSANVGTFTTDASGSFGPISVTVQQNFTAGGLPATCSAATPCSLFAQMNAQPQNAHESISFAGTTTTTSSTTTTLAPTTTTSSTTTTLAPTTTTSSTTTTLAPTTTTSSTTTTLAPTTTTTTMPVPPVCSSPPGTPIAGKNVIEAQPGTTTFGTEGPDVIYGTPGPDRIAGLGGDDLILGYGGDDQLSGGDGDDTLCGGEGNDALLAGGGNDDLVGEAGNDDLAGGPGNDRLFGGAGVDRLAGGDGGDSCVPGGQSGDAAAPPPSCDTIS